jgi:effector-binding domain-containing protein
MLDTPEITQTRFHHAAVVHLTIPRDQIGSAMGPAIEEVTAAIAAQGVAPEGPFFSHHLRLDTEIFDFEVGVPVSEPVAPTGRVIASSLPAAKVARVVYRGPYEDLGVAWQEFDAWITDHGHTPAADLWEVYLSGPEAHADPAQWRTQLVRPLINGATGRAL